MPNISTLIQDIYALIQTKGWFDDDFARYFEIEVSKRVQPHFQDRAEKGSLRLSGMGAKCQRALWYSVNSPGDAEALPPYAIIKYSYGHIIEALALTLAKAAGHEVCGEQDEITLDGVTGHRDCIIDGCIVDVKSTSSRGLEKFKNKTIGQDDAFGYLDQLDGYVVGSYDDPLVTTKDRGYILAIDKQLGHMCLYEHIIREQSIKERIRDYQTIVSLREPPPCTCETIPDGKSGNIRLGVKASYSPYKHCCFPKLRTFLYANGPVYLSHVAKRPMNKDGPILEIDRNGKAVYH